MRWYTSLWFFNLAVALFIPLVLGSRTSDRQFSISESRTTLHTTRFWHPESPPPLGETLKGAVSKMFIGRQMQTISHWFRRLPIWEDIELEPRRDKASSLRMFEDATFISIQELPRRVAQAGEGEKYSRSESFEDSEVIPHERMSGDRTVHHILGLVEAEMSSKTAVEVTR